MKPRRPGPLPGILVGILVAAGLLLAFSPTGSAQLTANCSDTLRDHDAAVWSITFRDNLSGLQDLPADDVLEEEQGANATLVPGTTLQHTQEAASGSNVVRYNGSDCRFVNDEGDGEGLFLNDTALSADSATAATDNGLATVFAFEINGFGDSSVFNGVLDYDAGHGNFRMEIKFEELQIEITDESGTVHSKRFNDNGGGIPFALQSEKPYGFAFSYFPGNDTWVLFGTDDMDQPATADWEKIGQDTVSSVASDLDNDGNDHNMFAPTKNLDDSITSSFVRYFNESVPVNDLTSLGSRPFIAGPSADFSFTCDGRTCTFTDESVTPGAIEDRNWTFGDGTTNTNNQSTVTHTYDTFGSFDVTLAITNTTGATDSTTKTVTTVLEPEFNVTAGLVAGSTLRHVAVDWRKASPAVWGRDTRSTGSQTDGTLVEWNETLTHENTFTLCPGTDRQENNQPLGLSVSKDTPGRPVNACVDTALSDPVILARKTNGDVQSEFVAGTATGVPVDVGARSLNNVSTGENTGFRQLLDVPEGDVKWRISDGKSFVRHAIDRDAAEDPLLCSTDDGSFGTGTECRDADGFVIGSDSGVSGADVGVHGDVVHLLDEAGETLERRTPGLTLTNSTNLHPAHHAPVAVSKTGRFIAHTNLSGSDAESVVIRHAGNGSRIVETTNFGGNRGVNSLAWHPRDERVYAVNDTRIWAFNLTTITSTSDEATGEDTTVDAEPEPTQEDDTPAFGDPQQTASALNISLDAAQTFLGLILVLALTAGSVFAASEAGVSGGGSLAVGLVAMGVGVILVNRLGWFPIWAVFGMFMLAAAVLVLRAGSGGGA